MDINNINMGYLKIILGSMFAGKTTELVKEYKRHESCGFECLFINHKIDTRYVKEENKTSTHDRVFINSINIGDNLFDFFKKQSFLDRYDVVLINEGQFFQDLYKFVDYIVNSLHKKVYVCGLDGDYKRKKIGSILDIIPLCDDVIKLKAICSNCKTNDGIFTYRLTKEKEQIVVGVENYSVLCRKCYNNMNQIFPVN
jgi:thymidine kinase|tara:strand:+ start:152 stop:745 length:594 start_codon:yes stop_codon:yes gene_type:complete